MIQNTTITKGKFIDVRSLCDRRLAGSGGVHFLGHCRSRDGRLDILGRRLAPAAALAAVALLLVPAAAQAYCDGHLPCRCYMSPHVGKRICTDEEPPRPVPPEWRREREFGPWKDPYRPREWWPPPPNPYWPR